MKQNGSIALFQYWNRLRNGRKAPMRSEIVPADIRSLLADLFILERDIRRGAVFRLAGTRLCAVYGRELKGSSFRSLWSKEDQTLIAGLSGDVFALKSGAVLSVTSLTRSGRENNFEFLLLPLEGGQRTTPRCLGAVSACRKPFWLGADPIIETRVEAVRIVDPESDPKSPIDRMEVGAPTLTPNATFYTDSEPAPFSGRRIRHLVVLEGGRRQ